MKSRYLMAKQALHWFGARTWTPPTAWYAGLFSAAPTGPDDAGTELSGAGYGRSAQGNGAFYLWSGAPFFGGAEYLINAQAITWPTATATWEPIVGWGIWDAATDGNLLYSGPVSPAWICRRGARVVAERAGLMVHDAVPQRTRFLVLYSQPAVLTFGIAGALANQPATWDIHLRNALGRISGGGYAAVAVPNDAAHWGCAAGCGAVCACTNPTIYNRAAITFGPATTEWGNIDAIDLVGDFNLTGGKLIWWQARADALKTIGPGASLTIPAYGIALADL